MTRPEPHEDQLTGNDLLRHRHKESHRRCPHCDADLMKVAIVDLAYTIEQCDCAAADYVHLAEQLWHRDHLVARIGGELLEALEQRDRLVQETAADVLFRAQKAVMKEAGRGESAAPARQRLTYTGGLRRAASILDNLLGEVSR